MLSVWIAPSSNERSPVYAATIDLRNRARALDEIADRLAHRAEAIGWQGYAAEAMRRRARDAVTELRRCAGLHDDAAEALERHRRAALANPVGQVAHGLMSVANDMVNTIGDLL